MDQVLGKITFIRRFARCEGGGAAFDLALLAGLAALSALALKHGLATPLLDNLVRASQTLSRVLG